MIHHQLLLLLLQRLLRGLPHEINMQQHAQAAHKFHLHSGPVRSAPLTVCRGTIGCSQKANKQFNSMRSRERDSNNSCCTAVWHVAKVIGCATLMPSCNVAVNHRADTATDRGTDRQSNSHVCQYSVSLCLCLNLRPRLSSKLS